MQTRTPWGDLTVVIVTYNSATAIAACLARVRHAARVIVVDNASHDDTVTVARAALPTVEVVALPRNEGYGTAANRGMERIGTGLGLLVTPDALLEDGALDRLAAALTGDPQAALTAPLLTGAQGRPDLAVMGPGERTHRAMVETPDGPFCSWFVNGAVCLWRMEAWRQVGGFDEAIFLYCEDLDLCLRTSRAGLSMVVEPAARAGHAGGRSTTPNPAVQRLKDWHQIWSHLYLAAKHGDPAAAKVEGRAMAIRYALRGLLYVLLLRKRRVRDNFLKAGAALTFLRGRPARRPGTAR